MHIIDSTNHTTPDDADVVLAEQALEALQHEHSCISAFKEDWSWRCVGFTTGGKYSSASVFYSDLVARDLDWNVNVSCMTHVLSYLPVLLFYRICVHVG